MRACLRIITSSLEKRGGYAGQGTLSGPKVDGV